MQVLSSAARRSAFAACRPRLSLRVRQGDGTWEQVEIRGKQCAIGSGPRCALRLPIPGIAPLHCLIVLDEDLATVRRWSADTRLNGQTFDVAPLSPGDLLELGSVPIEVDLIEFQSDRTNLAASSQPDEECSSAQTGSEVPSYRDQEGTLPPAVEEVFDQLRAANESSRQRSRRLLAALREDRRARRELESRLQQLETQLASSIEEYAPAFADAPLHHTSGDPAAADANDFSSPPADGEQTHEVAGPESEPELEAELPDWPEPNRLSGPFESGPPEAQPVDEAYRALLADRLERIEQLERELGIFGQAAGSESDAEAVAGDRISAGDANTGDIEPTTPDAAASDVAPSLQDDSTRAPFDDRLEAAVSNPSLDDNQVSQDAPSPFSPTASDSLEDPWRPSPEANEDEFPPASEMPSAEALRQGVEGEGIPESRAAGDTDPVPSIEQPGFPEDPPPAIGALEDSLPVAAPADEAARQTPSAKLSPDTASFWGFSEETAGVDEDLLGPLARSSRRGSLTTPGPYLRPSRPLEGTPPGPEFATPGAEAEPVVPAEPMAAPATHEQTEAGASDPADPGEVQSEAAPSPYKLPGASPPAIPGLSDSAWAHLRELSIWKEKSDSVPAEDAATEQDAASEAEEPPPPNNEEAGYADAVESALAPPAQANVPDESDALDAAAPVGALFDSSLATESDSSQQPVPSEFNDAPGEDVSIPAMPSIEPDNDEADEAPVADVPVEMESESVSHGDELRLPTLSTAFDAPGAEAASPPPATESFIERYAHLFDEEAAATGADQGEPVAYEEPQSDVGQGTFGAQVSEPQSLAGGDEEESIDEYMAQLMRRIRGDSIADSPSVPTPAPAPSVKPMYHSPEAVAPPQAPVAEHTESTSAEPPLSLEALRRSGPVPEQTTDMSALRDLANQTARSAIGAHASRKYRENATSKLLVAFAAVASGMYLLATAPELVSLQFGGACLAVLAALYWCTVILRSLAEANRAKAESEQGGKTPPRLQLPIDAPTSGPEQSG